MLIYLHMGALPPAGPDLRLHTADEQRGVQPYGHAVVALRQPHGGVRAVPCKDQAGLARRPAGG